MSLCSYARTTRPGSHLASVSANISRLESFLPGLGVIEESEGRWKPLRKHILTVFKDLGVGTKIYYHTFQLDLVVWLRWPHENY